MNESHDYWGDINYRGKISLEITPTTILKDQAENLTRRTGNLLRGRVVTTDASFDEDSPTLLRSILFANVPNIGNRYSINIVTIIFPLDFYPLQLFDELDKAPREEKVYRCRDENTFRKNLREILSSNNTITTLKRLMSIQS